MKEALEEIAHQLTRIADQGEQVGMQISRGMPWKPGACESTRKTSSQRSSVLESKSPTNADKTTSTMHLPWMQSQSHATRTLRPTPTQAMAESISAHTSLETTPHRMDARQSRTHEARTELQTMQP